MNNFGARSTIRSFIGLITELSFNLHMFCLSGARWGISKPMVPLLAAALTQHIEGPNRGKERPCLRQPKRSSPIDRQPGLGIVTHCCQTGHLS